MLPDPTAIGSYEWSEIGQLLNNLWFYLASVVTLALTLLVAHAVIPSLVSTGHLTQSANLLRFSLTIAALGVLGLALTILAYTVNLARIIELFYDRYWI